MPGVSNLFKRFRADRAGSLTIWNTVTMIAILSIGGLAVDTSNAWRVKTLLQNTAEASALVAAIHIEDQADARDKAIAYARRNMPQGIHGDVVTSDDIIFGTYNRTDGTFEPGGTNPDSVMVTAGRNAARSNAVSTYLLRIAGVNGWDVGRTAVAFPKWTPGTVGGCEGAKVLSSGTIATGDSNTFVDGVCIHAEEGLDLGADAFFDRSVRISAESLLNIFLTSMRQGSVDPEDLAFQQTKDLTVLPTLDARFQEMWDTLSLADLDQYSGALLPDFIVGPNGTADVVHIDGNWQPREADIAPHTIYIVQGDVETVGGMDRENFAILATGAIRGGGGQSHFKNVFFFGEQEVSFSGSVSWGDSTSYCDSGAFNTYLLSNTHLFMGAKSNNSNTHGVLAAAPSFNAGGALKNTGGIYIETSNSITDLGGGIEITNACDQELSSFMETSEFASRPYVSGSTLRP